MKTDYDVIIIGAGAAGMMAAWQAGLRGKSVLLLEKEAKVGKKIRISGGGRCNFTNMNASHENYVSSNPHFCKSALKQYTQYDFIDLVEGENIEFYEKKLGQLFCVDSAQQIIDLMLDLCKKNNVDIRVNAKVETITKDGHFSVYQRNISYTSDKLIITSGGLSIPKIGATDFAYNTAIQFGHHIISTRPGLVPIKFHRNMERELAELSGISFHVKISTKNISFEENLLMTHQGFSGPAILQISNYLVKGDSFTIDLLPQFSVNELEELINQNSSSVKKYLETLFPKRFVRFLQSAREFDMDSKAQDFALSLKNWSILFTESTGYGKAEVTLGGIDTNEISSKTMESKLEPGLFFAGEALDVTGQLGGFNFQWAWSSGFVAGNNV